MLETSERQNYPPQIDFSSFQTFFEIAFFKNLFFFQISVKNRVCVFKFEKGKTFPPSAAKSVNISAFHIKNSLD